MIETSQPARINAILRQEARRYFYARFLQTVLIFPRIFTNVCSHRTLLQGRGYELHSPLKLLVGGPVGESKEVDDVPVVIQSWIRWCLKQWKVYERKRTANAELCQLTVVVIWSSEVVVVGRVAVVG